MHQDLYLFRIKYRFCNFRSMQIRLRNLPSSKPPMSDSKTILISWLSFSSVMSQIWILVVMWKNGMCEFGLTFMSRPSLTSIAHFVWRSDCLVGIGLFRHYRASLVRGCWWTSGNCEHEWYIEAMRRDLIPTLRRKWGMVMDVVFCQQNEATPHCSNASLKYLHRCIPGDRLILHHIDHPWPAHSPDLNTLWIIFFG